MHAALDHFYDLARLLTRLAEHVADNDQLNDQL